MLSVDIRLTNNKIRLTYNNDGNPARVTRRHAPFSPGGSLHASENLTAPIWSTVCTTADLQSHPARQCRWHELGRRFAVRVVTAEAGADVEAGRAAGRVPRSELTVMRRHELFNSSKLLPA